MLYKPRTKSTELLTLQSLNSRMNLPEKAEQRYLNLKKGYEGEVLFDTFTEKLHSDCYILNDLYLHPNNSNLQMDSLIIFFKTLYLFEVKNYKGDFYYESDRIYTLAKTEVNNPFTQVTKNESLLRQLQQSLGIHFDIIALVVFINPEFNLYQAPLNKPFLFPNQVENYLKKLDKNHQQLNGKHKMLADKLISLHTTDTGFDQLPPYNYDQLKKGMDCKTCGSLSVTVDGRTCTCHDCGYVEPVDEAVIRNVEEIKLLFPGIKITTNLVFDWCKVVGSKERIRDILRRYMEIIGVHQWAYFK